MQSMTNEIQWLLNKIKKSKASFLTARLADRYIEVQELDKALDYAQQAVDSNPGYATAHYILAKCHYQRTEYDNSENEVNETLRLDPTYLGALKLKSELETRLSDFDAVHTTYQKILTHDPMNKDIADKLELVDTTSESDSSGISSTASAETDTDWLKNDDTSKPFEKSNETEIEDSEDLFSPFISDDE